MKVLSWNGPKLMEIERVEEPIIAAEEVLIKVDVVGICGSEIEGFLGHNSLRKPPLVMGHEFCGYIVERGSDVTNIKMDEKVVVNPLLSCGQCPYCRKGLENLCKYREIIGIHHSGGFADLVAVPASSVTKVPETLNSYTASLSEPLACTYRAVRRAIDGHSRPNVLIYGGGTMGLLSGFVSQILGASKVILADINSERRSTVEKAGILHTLDPNNSIFSSKLQEITNEEGVDVIIDAAGFTPTRTQAANIINPGGTIMNIGLGIDETSLPINDFIRSEIKVLGSFCYSKNDFYEAVQMLVEGKIDEAGWSEIRNLEEGHQAFSDLTEGRVAKSKIFLNV